MSVSVEKFSIKITDPKELEIAKEWRDATQKLADEGRALLVQHEQETKEFAARHKKISRDFFRRLTEKHIADPDEAFRTGEWYADICYVHLHGDAYLVKANSPTALVEPEDDPDSDDGQTFEIN